MKKTTTINLNGSVIHIDEDAYDRLAAYLDDLKIHFKDEEGGDEILSDIESRIGDLFKIRLRYGIEVVTIRDVEEVIEIMGLPEQFEIDSSILKENAADSSADSLNENSTETKKDASGNDSPPPPPEVQEKTLFRDTEKGYLGGVAAGLKWYIGISAVWIRLILVVLTFFYGASILIYLLFWIVVPAAKTVSQKMQMRGERINVDTIKQTVQEEKERFADRPETTEHSSGGRTVLRVIFVILAVLIGSILLFFFIPTLTVLLPFLWVGSHVFDGNMTCFPESHLSALPDLLSQSFPFVIGLLLTLGIPLLALFRFAIIKIINGVFTKAINWTLVVFWIIGLFMMMISGGQILNFFLKEFLHQVF